MDAEYVSSAIELDTRNLPRSFAQVRFTTQTFLKVKCCCHRFQCAQHLFLFMENLLLLKLYISKSYEKYKSLRLYLSFFFKNECKASARRAFSFDSNDLHSKSLFSLKRILSSVLKVFIFNSIDLKPKSKSSFT